MHNENILTPLFADYEEFCKRADEFIENYKKHYKELEDLRNGKDAKGVYEV